MSSLRRAVDLVDGFNERLAWVLSPALLAIMIIQVMDVVLRYFFNAPTIWAMDVNTMTFTGVCFLAGAYALLHDSHVKLDILYRKWSPRGRTVLDLITLPLALVAICFVIWQGLDALWWAVKTNQHGQSYWGPPLWPVKLCLPLGGLLLLIQGLAKWGRLLLSLLEPEPAEGTEEEGAAR